MTSMRERYGLWAVIVGGSSGIGRALAHRLASDGLNVVLVARRIPALEETAESIRAMHGVEVRAVQADMGSDVGVDALIEAVEDLEVGVLVPGAAIESNGYFVHTAEDTHRRMVRINVEAPMRLAHHFGGAMAGRGRGAILLVSSLSGWNGQPYMAAYGATKAFVLSLGEALHQEMKDYGVDVAVLSPGPTDTPMIADLGIDFASMGMAVMPPDAVANAGVAALGRRANAVPGMRNRLMVWFLTRVLPRSWATALFHRMLGQALGLGAHQAPPAARLSRSGRAQ